MGKKRLLLVWFILLCFALAQVNAQDSGADKPLQTTFHERLLNFNNMYRIQIEPLWYAYEDMDTARAAFIVNGWLKELQVEPLYSADRKLFETVFLFFDLLLQQEVYSSAMSKNVEAVTFKYNPKRPAYIDLGGKTQLLCKSISITENSLIVFFPLSSAQTLSFFSAGKKVEIKRCLSVELGRDGMVLGFSQK